MKRKIFAYRRFRKKAARFLKTDIWRMSLKDLSPRDSFLVKQLRVLILALRGVREDNILLRAPALTFYSMFSIVPVVALAFGIANGFGLEMYVERQLQAALTGREEVFNWVMEIVDSFFSETDGGTVAAVGLLILLYTITMLLVNIEESFNRIWQVNKSRSWSRRFSDYFAMMFLAPLFFIMASAATVYLNTQLQQADNGLLNPVILGFVRLIPYLLIWTIFTLLYIIMPNTNVRFSSAAIAGIIAGTIFQLVQWAYIAFQIGAAKYGAIYGSFAAVPLLLLWMQVSWIVVLFGAELSFASQHVKNYEFESETRNISQLNKRILAVYILQRIVKNFQNGERPMSSDQLSEALHIPNSLTRNILNDLEDTGLVAAIDSSPAKEYTFQPAIDINAITIRRVLERLDKKGMNVLIAKSTPTLEQIKVTLYKFYDILEGSDHNRLLKDLEP